ncbi:probable rRNA-processing protein EBP2 [Bombina bombina]|uniref:probable rRNA-processing protein EBP2 n=1 Tax=Bombina bombina TaxID=8345 RepID=UPI00235AD209|nr:probable rRNA-processing protein EBP2 [Bombina bombina]XP_053549588.1 probable rRNA-processing protein EBP2 [Bombina bombina]
MLDHEEESASESDSDFDPSELTDKELQEAFAQGKLKPGLNVVLEGKKKPFNDLHGLKQSLNDLKNELPWLERLDVTEALEEKGEASHKAQTSDSINAEDDFQREMCFYRQAQAALLFALPRLHKLKVSTKRPDDYFAEMAKSDQHMQKIRHKLQTKQAAMEKTEKAKQLRALRKYGKKVQIGVLQQRQKEKSSMMMQIKKYQKGLSDKLDFLEGDQPQKKNDGSGFKKQKKGPNAKRRYKDQKFGFGGRKKGSKRNTRDSVNDVSSFRAGVAHAKGQQRPGKKGAKNASKRPGKSVRQKMKNKGR